MIWSEEQMQALAFLLEAIQKVNKAKITAVNLELWEDQIFDGAKAIGLPEPGYDEILDIILGRTYQEYSQFKHLEQGLLG